MYSQIIEKSDKQGSKSNFRLKITSNKVVKTERQLQSGSQTFDYGGANKDEANISQGNKPYNYINDPNKHANRTKIRTKTPNIPRLPIDKISNTPTSLNNNSQKKIIDLKNI